MIQIVDEKRIKRVVWLLEALLGCKEEELEAVLRVKAPVISIVGGGGKTTCVKALASECYRKGIDAVVATTTHMQMPHDEFLLDVEDMDSFYKLMEQTGQVWLGRRLDFETLRNDKNMVRNKRRALSLDFVRQVSRESHMPVFIEADGAKGLPCKVPADHEPVIIPETTHVVNVYGMDVLDMPIKEVTFRIPLVCALLQKDALETVKNADLVRLATSAKGGRKSVADHMHYCVVLNKADSPALQDRAEKIARRMLEAGVERVLITGRLHDLM